MIDSAFSIPPLTALAAVLYRLLAIMTVAFLVIWGRRNPAKRGDIEALKQRFLTYLLLIVAYFASAYVGGLAFLGFALLLILACIHELFKIVSPQDAIYYRVLTAIVVLVEAGAALFVNRPGLSVNNVPLFYLVPPVVVALLALSPVFLQKPKQIFANVGCTIFGALYLGWFLSHLVLLRGLSGGFGLVSFLFVCVALNDTLAYTVGRCIGRHKMCPAISPAKTWEGFAGGAVGTALGALFFYHVLSGVSVYVAALLALVTAIFAPLGDLVISALKREFQAKDSGSILPGHGGVLDRFDSLVLTAPLYYYISALCS